MTYSVEITKDGKTRFFGFNSADKADRFAKKCTKEGFSCKVTGRDTMEVLRELFAGKFVGVAS